MNSLQKELGPKGLVVVGVTNEAESMVVKDVEKSKMAHPIVMISGEETDRVYGINGYPSGFLIDPSGTIVWSGHPGNLDKDELRAMVEKLGLPPALPAEFKDIDELLAGNKLGKAHTALTKALVKAPDSGELKTALEFVTKSLEARLAEAKAHLDNSEFGEALRVWTEVSLRYEGAPGIEAAKAGIDALKKDKTAVEDLAAAEKLKDAVELWRKGDLDKALKAYATVARKYPDTATGKRAAELVSAHEE